MIDVTASHSFFIVLVKKENKFLPSILELILFTSVTGKNSLTLLSRGSIIS